MNGVVKLIVLIIALAIGNVIYKLNKHNPIQIPEETYWGPGDFTPDDPKIVPFKIDVPASVLEDLKTRLKNARDFVPSLEGVNQHYGMNSQLLKTIVDFWLTKYNWREREKFLNQFLQFKTKIQGLDIHFIHAKPQNVPKGVKVLPLLLLHGWPGSVREFYEIIPLLTTAQKDKSFVFEVIAPSLPGYGFSQGASKPGLGPAKVGTILKNLMKKLGFEKFYVQGGDWGSWIGSSMATCYPEHVKGLHSNMCYSTSWTSKFKHLLGSLWPSLITDEKDQHKVYPVTSFISNMVLEFGYLHLQATKPDTIAFGLSDSPTGLAAYILEKFTTWTNPDWKNRDDGGLLEKFTYTELLDNIMIYWVTNSITTSLRLYYEAISKVHYNMEDYGAVPVPSACALFNNEIIYQPVTLFKDKFPKLLQANRYDGGHFAAFEVPETLAKDVWLFVSKVEAEPKTSSK